MSLRRAAKLWNLAPSTMLAPIAVLTGAALWFIIQAVARPEFKILCAGKQSRLKCVYHSVSMAGAALMITMMTSHITPGAAEAMPLPNAHHSIPQLPRATATLDHLPSLAAPPPTIFATAALIFIALLPRPRQPAPPDPHRERPARGAPRARAPRPPVVVRGRLCAQAPARGPSRGRIDRHVGAARRVA